MTKLHLIIVLAVVAVGLGILILKPQGGNLVGRPSPTVSVVPVNRNLTEDQKKLLQVPTKDSSQEEIRAHYNLALKLSVASSVLDIANCDVNPMVLKVKDGSSFTIKNSGNQDRSISFDRDNTIYVPAGKTHVQKAQFKNGPGLYGYGCDLPSIQQAAGFVLVEPKQ